MNSITSLLSPEGYDWGVPSISDGLSQGHAGPSNVPSHAEGFHPYDSFHETTTMIPQIPSAFRDAEPRFPSPEDVTMEEQEDTRQENPRSPSSSLQPVPRRSRHGNLDFENQKEELKRLYLIEDKSLKDVMAFMKENHSLPES
jgi:hypothetical protein